MRQVRLRRREALRALLVGTVGLTLAAACTPVPGPSTSTQPASGTAVAASSTGQARSGGTLHIGMVGDVATLDGHVLTTSGFLTYDQVYDTLIRYDAGMTPQPVLAESWEITPDLKRYQFNLRKGVTYHDGRPFTSEDVKYNLLRVRDPKVPSPILRAPSNWWTAIDTPDSTTIVLTSDLSRPGAFDFFSQLNIVDKNTTEGPNAGTQINGTGAFRLVEWVQGDHLTFARHPNYWMPGKPYLDGFVLHTLADGQSMVVQFETGVLDIANGPSLQDAIRLKGNPAYNTIVTNASGGYFCFIPQTKQPPFDNKIVRQALNYAIDRDRWANSIMKGLAGPPQDLVWPPQVPAWDAAKNNVYTFDLDKARSLLNQAGVSGLSLPINYSTGLYPAEYAEMAQIYQADLARIGVTATLNPMPPATFQEVQGRRGYQGIWFFLGGFAQFNEAGSALTIGFNPGSNIAQFNAPEYQELVNKASTEPDTATRRALYGQINDYLLDQSFVLPLSRSLVAAVLKPRVHGLNYTPGSSVLYLSEAWLNG